MNSFYLQRTSKIFSISLIVSLFLFSACMNNQSLPTSNPATYITDKDKLDMIYSLVDLEGDKGRIYEVNYTSPLQIGMDIPRTINM